MNKFATEGSNVPIIESSCDGSNHANLIFRISTSVPYHKESAALNTTEYSESESEEVVNEPYSWRRRAIRYRR